jgi:hypothetical protein
MRAFFLNRRSHVTRRQIAMGDSRSYILSTAEEELGVVLAHGPAGQFTTNFVFLPSKRTLSIKSLIKLFFFFPHFQAWRWCRSLGQKCSAP